MTVLPNNPINSGETDGVLGFMNSNRMSDSISWSNHGFIAYTSSNPKHNLLLTYLENVDGSTWRLAKPQRITVEIGNSKVPELNLLKWSSLSTDLAVADIYGNFFIFLAGVGLIERDQKSDQKNGNGSNINGSSSSGSVNSPSYELTSYNHMEMIYQDVIPNNPINNGHSIVAFKWLYIEKPQMINQPANLVNLTNENSGNNSNSPVAYTYRVSHFQPKGVTHPIPTKQACLALRKNGNITLYYQGEHKVEYHKLSTQLCDEAVVLSKASIGFNKDKEVIVCLYDTLSSKVITYSITIDWGFLIESAKRQKADPQFNTPKEAQRPPSLIVKKIHEMKVLSNFIASLEKEVDSDQMDIDNDTDIPVEIGYLESIDVMSPTSDNESELDILMTYTINCKDKMKSTRIYQYRLTDAMDFITDAFDVLAARKNLGNSNETSTKIQNLTVQGILQRPARLLSMEQSQSDQYVLMHFDDGRIDVLHRLSLTLANGKKSLQKVPPATISTIFDVGFDFLKIKNANQNLVAVSPNLTSMVCINLKDDVPQLHVVEKVSNLEITPQVLYTTAVAFAYRHAESCYSNSCSDDLMVLIREEIKRITHELRNIRKENLKNEDIIINRFVGTILSESHKAVNFQLDAFSKESFDKLLSNPPLQKLLSLQLILGEVQEKNHVISDIAWIILNLRSTSFGIMFLLSSIIRQMSKKRATQDSLQDSIVRAECIISLVGNVKWFIDLVTYIYQELFQLSFYLQDPSNSLLNLQNSIALPIILSKVPRLFLMYALSSIGKTNEILKKLHKDLTDSNKLFTPMKEALNRFFNIYNQATSTLNSFEGFLRECDAYITKEIAAKLASKTSGESLKLEQKLVCQGELTEDMQQIARVLIKRHSVNLAQHTKVSELFFYDVEWLGIGINNLSKSKKLNIEGSSVANKFPIAQDTSKPRLYYNEKECIDALRKIVINMAGYPFLKSNSGKLRKCTRCRSVSLVTDPLVFDNPGSIGLWTMVFQRACICGNSWVNISN